MSETATEQTAEEQNADQSDVQPEQPKPTETVDFWKQKAREQEKRAKDNKAAADANRQAADELAKIKEGQQSESERMAARISKADAEVAAIPAKVAEELKGHLVSLHSISDEDAELFLTATKPDVLLKQVSRLVEREQAREAERKKQGNHVPREGANPTASESDEREAVRSIFGG